MAVTNVLVVRVTIIIAKRWHLNLPGKLTKPMMLFCGMLWLLNIIKSTLKPKQITKKIKGNTPKSDIQYPESRLDSRSTVQGVHDLGIVVDRPYTVYYTPYGDKTVFNQYIGTTTTTTRTTNKRTHNVEKSNNSTIRMK